MDLSKVIVDACDTKYTGIFDPCDPNGELAFTPKVILPTEYGARIIWDVNIVRAEDLLKLQNMYISFTEDDMKNIEQFISESDEKSF